MKVTKQPASGRASRLSAEACSRALRSRANPEHARILQRFFKTGPGEYGEGDVFIGLKVPAIREVVRRFRALPPRDAGKLVRSEIHEVRLTGLLLWVDQFERGSEATRRRIFELYLRHRKHINNWDLVDASAPHIVGRSVDPADTTLLEALADSAALWDRRIAVVATLSYIRQGRFGPTLRLCRKLLADQHDLLHKACGWMLRELGKRDKAALSGFLDRYSRKMPRVMLRYTLEHYSPSERRKYMNRRARSRVPAA